MAQFRKRPVEAVQWLGTNRIECARLIKARIENGDLHNFPGHLLFIETPEGVVRADIGDWIIRDAKGEICACKPDIFAATYDPLDATPTPPVHA